MVVEMFPIQYRTFYGVAFHLFVSIFEAVFPLIAKAIQDWKLIQVAVTTPLVLTFCLYWISDESIFWHLAHKEYDKAIKTLSHLAKRNGISFESKFKQAKEFLHAKHSKAIQTEMLPLMRLQDIEVYGKKYPTIDIVEMQKQKVNSSKLRRFLNSLKGSHYRSTNTIYYPFDFFYSPIFVVYFFILAGLWFINGLSESIESVKKTYPHFDVFTQESVFNTCYIAASIAAILLSLIR